jgi:hypothetical protein
MPHQSEDALSDQLIAAAQQVSVGSLYAHYKHPEQTYLVKGFAILEAAEEVGVIYEAQYGNGICFVRALSSWLDEVPVDGVPQPRFHIAK